jgi:choline dehydrogenase
VTAAPAADVQELGIPLVADRPGVGAHLLDHPLLQSAGQDGVAAYVVKPEYAPAAPSFFRRMIKARSRRAVDEIDLHIYHLQVPDEERGCWTAWFDLSLQEARSRGRVCLASPDPAAALEIDHGYFNDPTDLEALCDGAELVARLVSTEPLAAAVDQLDGANPDWRDRDSVRAWVRGRAATTFHPSSTCRLGPVADVMAVVDHAGRVYGVAGLRVADASIFPTSPRANIHYTVVAVAEKLADAIRSDRA